MPLPLLITYLYFLGVPLFGWLTSYLLRRLGEAAQRSEQACTRRARDAETPGEARAAARASEDAGEVSRTIKGIFRYTDADGSLRVMVFLLYGLLWPALVVLLAWIVIAWAADPVIGVLDRRRLIECDSCGQRVGGWGARRVVARARARQWLIGDAGDYCRACQVSGRVPAGSV